MGVKLPGILPVSTIEWNKLKGKKIGIDFSNCAYQFLSSIRNYDGTHLMDSKGRVTSLYSGLFFRSLNLMQKGIKICYIFDGKPPELKYQTQKKRRERKEIANEKYKQAKEEDNINQMQKYSKQVSYLNNEMVKESKELVKALGLPIIQSPQEADAQGAFCVERKDLWTFASSDSDCLLQGCPRLIPNLTLSQTRKLPGKKFVYIQPYMIELKDVLKHLKINQDQLIVMGILTGTDYNPKGIPGIGPKKALNLVQQYKKFDSLFSKLEPDFNWKKIYAIFKSMPVMKNYQLKWKPIDEEKVKEILVEKYEFNKERIESALEKLEEYSKEREQSDLDKWI
ncbi:flap endonuclease-1 [archaeon]|nr:flap endonuclease-1 [archaeon]|tara:strand:- start:2388 stop:3404 length:1017 start_codon:yes stop_codon:yes gene_type:complete